MMNKSKVLGLILTCFLLIFLQLSYVKAQDFTKWVDPMIGTGGNGHVYPGATVPFGMVQLSPDQIGRAHV